MKKVLMIVILIGIVWGIHGYYLRRVMILEQELEDKKIELENNVKAYNEKVIEYDKKLDLSAIKKDMEKRKGMHMAEEIKYFEIRE